MRKTQLIRILFLPLLIAGGHDALLSQVPGICSNDLRASRGTSGMSYTGGDSSGIYLVESLREKTPSILLMRLGRSDMKERWSKTIVIPQPAIGGQEFERLLVWGSAFFLFTSGPTEVSGEYQYYVSTFDSLGQQTTPPVLIHYSRDTQRNHKPELVCTTSPDQSRLLVLLDPPFERRTNEAIQAKVYDASLELIWEKNLELPYDQDVVQVHHYLLDNSGGLYMMSGENPEKNNSQWQKPQGSRSVVFYYNHEANHLKEYDISLRDKQVISAQPAIQSNGDLIIAGYYSNDFNFSVAGTFLFVVAAGAQEIRAASLMAFPREFLQQFMNQKQASRNGTLNDFYLDHLVLNSDSSFYLIGEQYYITEEIIMDPTTGRQLIEKRYNYDDIIVTRLQSDGRIEWSVKVPKRQFDMNNNPQSSYLSYVRDESLIFFFNDHPENNSRLASLPQGDATSWNGSRHAVITRVNVAPDGSIIRSQFADAREMDMLLRPMLTRSDPTSEIILGLEGSRSYRFCRVAP